MIGLKRELEAQLIGNDHEDDKELQRWIWELPVFSQRVMRDIMNYENDEHKPVNAKSQ